jgi:hypothetical protein
MAGIVAQIGYNRSRLNIYRRKIFLLEGSPWRGVQPFEASPSFPLHFVEREGPEIEVF